MSRAMRETIFSLVMLFIAFAVGFIVGENRYRQQRGQDALDALYYMLGTDSLVFLEDGVLDDSLIKIFNRLWMPATDDTNNVTKFEAGYIIDSVSDTADYYYSVDSVRGM